MLYCILSISAGITFFSQVDLHAYSIKDSSQTILKKKRIYSPVQTITGDTLQIDSVKKYDDIPEVLTELDLLKFDVKFQSYSRRELGIIGITVLAKKSNSKAID